MHWTDLLALVPLIALVYFIFGMRGLFKDQVHAGICVGLFILTGIIHSFYGGTLFTISFVMLVAGIGIGYLFFHEP